MKRVKYLVGLAVVMSVLALVFALPVSAAPPETVPDENASHIAQCSAMIGGQHVAEHARMMEKGVSGCAQMGGPDEMMMMY